MRETATAVLFSSGLDSAVLLAEEAALGPVRPLYLKPPDAVPRAAR